MSDSKLMVALGGHLSAATYLWSFYRTFRDGATDIDEIERWSRMAERSGQRMDAFMALAREGCGPQQMKRLEATCALAEERGRNAARKAGANVREGAVHA